MELILGAVALVALVVAVVMAVMLAGLKRDERRRSDARVALLQDLAAEPVPADAFRLRHSPKPAARPPAAPRAARAFAVDELELHPGSDTGVRADLFQPEAGSSLWPRRLVVAAALVAALGLATFVWTNVPGSRALTQPSALASFKPLELVSLDHAQDAGALTISGLVQNPRTGIALAGIEATVLVYDRSGALLASGRSPIDIRALAPGDESPFVIRVPVSGSVTRYRIGFRGPDDRVLGHVDRRTSAPVARRQDP